MSIRLYAELGATLLVVFLFLLYRHSLIVEGENQISSQDARAAAAQAIAIENQKEEDAKLLEESKNAHAIEVVQDTAVVPVAHVLCYATRPSSMPITAGVSSGAGTAAAPLPRPPASHFDPTDALNALALEADLLAASCRELNSDTHPQVTP